MLEKFLTDPLARIITDKAIPVTTLHEFFIPMVQRLKHFSSNSSDLLSEDCELIVPTHPPVADDLFDSIFKEINEAANKDLFKQALEVICEAFGPVASRQLKDHLPGGIFDNPSDKIKEQSKSTPKHILFGENDFGHLDYSQKQKPNASTKHHSSIVMTKINHTVSWLSKKSYSQRIKLQKLANIKAPTQTQKCRGWSRSVKTKRRQIILENVRRKQEKDDKRKANMSNLVESVMELGPCRTVGDITQMIKSQRTLSKKKKTLQIQIKYNKLVVKSKKVTSNLYNFSEKKKILTCGKLQDNLKSIISQIYGSEASSDNVTIKHITQMDDQIVGTNSSQFEFCECREWVIVAFEISWYPREVVDIISTERANVNFMGRIRKSFN